jgi:hypothetical protein
MLRHIFTLAFLSAFVLCKTYHFTANFLDVFQNGISCKTLTIHAIVGDIEERRRIKIYQSTEEIGGVYQFIWKNPSESGETVLEVTCEYQWLMRQDDYDETVMAWRGMDDEQKKQLIECTFGEDGANLRAFLAERGADELQVFRGKGTEQLVEVFSHYLSQPNRKLVHQNKKVILVTDPFVIDVDSLSGHEETVQFLDVTSTREAKLMKDQCMDFELAPGVQIKYGADGVAYPEDFYTRYGWSSYKDMNYKMKIFSEVDQYMTKKCNYIQGNGHRVQFDGEDSFEIPVREIDEKLNPPEVEMAALLKALSKNESKSKNTAVRRANRRACMMIAIIAFSIVFLAIIAGLSLGLIIRTILNRLYNI